MNIRRITIAALHAYGSFNSVCLQQSDDVMQATCSHVTPFLGVAEKKKKKKKIDSTCPGYL